VRKESALVRRWRVPALASRRPAARRLPDAEGGEALGGFGLDGHVVNDG
jgi:hypothetical protein